MKALHALLSALVLLYVLGEGTCGAIDVQQTVNNKEFTVFDKIISTIINGYETASQMMQELLDKHDGILASLYDKLKEEIEKLKDLILGGGKSETSEEIEDVERSIERIIEQYRRIHADTRLILDGAVQSVKNAERSEKIVHDGPDAVRHRVVDIDRALRGHILDGVARPYDSHSDVDHGYKSTADFLIKQGVKLSEEDKIALDDILNRARESLIHAKLENH